MAYCTGVLHRQVRYISCNYHKRLRVYSVYADIYYYLPCQCVRWFVRYLISFFLWAIISNVCVINWAEFLRELHSWGQVNTNVTQTTYHEVNLRYTQFYILYGTLFDSVLAVLLLNTYCKRNYSIFCWYQSVLTCEYNPVYQPIIMSTINIYKICFSLPPERGQHSACHELYWSANL
jgi:hypothetical protein